MGLLYDRGDRLTVGLAYKSRQWFSKLDYRVAAGDIDLTALGGGPLPAGTYRMELDYPQQLAVGAAYRVTPRVTVSGDLKWIDWSQTMDAIRIEGPGGVRADLRPGWSDQLVAALGVEFRATPRLALRAGVNHAEAPVDEVDVSSNLILPAMTETHVTVGAEYAVNAHWSLGFHYMDARRVTAGAPAADPMAPGAGIGLGERSVGVNLAYRF